MGFDDVRFARYTDPPLTTVSQPKADIGSEAMNMLLELLRDSCAVRRHRILPTQLVIRGSTARRLR